MAQGRVWVARESGYWVVHWESALYPGEARLARFTTEAAARSFAQRVRSDVRHGALPAGRSRTGRGRRVRRGPFADPGYRADKRKRYELSSAKKVRAAWGYINRPAYAKFYTYGQLKMIHLRIRGAGRRYGIEFGHARAR